MKIHGKKIQGPNRVIVPLPRPNNEDIIFIAEGIPDMEPFYKLCPQPEPPKVMLPGGKLKVDVEDKRFKQQFEAWAKQRSAWMAITSLRATPGLEWETVNYSDPTTWQNYEKELKASGLADNEIGRIIVATIEANGLSEERVEEARQRFLMLESTQENEPDSPTEEATTTQSGEPVNGSASSPQNSPASTSGITAPPGNNA